MKEVPQDVSLSTKRRNPHLYPSMYSHPGFCGTEVAAAIKEGKTPKRIRQSTKPLMNKLEQEWFEVLRLRYSYYFHPPTLCQSVRFKLGNGIWYKPDFFVPPLSTSFEVKGPYAFRGGFENLKVAAHLYPSMTWILVWKDKTTGKWQEQEVLP